MQVSKQWEDTLQKTTVCVPASVSEPDSVHEPAFAACNDDNAHRENVECRGSAEDQEVQAANNEDSVRNIESEDKRQDRDTYMQTLEQKIRAMLNRCFGKQE